MKRTFTKPSIPTFDDEHSSNLFDHYASDHLSSIQQQQRDEQKKKYLPPVRGAKMLEIIILINYYLLIYLNLGVYHVMYLNLVFENLKLNLRKYHSIHYVMKIYQNHVDVEFICILW